MMQMISGCDGSGWSKDDFKDKKTKDGSSEDTVIKVQDNCEV